jgi:hypothetical protein
MTDCVHLVDFCRYVYAGGKHQRRGVSYQCCTWWHPFVKYSIEALTLLHCLMHGVLKTNWTSKSCPSTLIFLTDVFQRQRWGLVSTCNGTSTKPNRYSEMAFSIDTEHLQWLHNHTFPLEKLCQQKCQELICCNSGFQGYVKKNLLSISFWTCLKEKPPYISAVNVKKLLCLLYLSLWKNILKTQQ